MKILSSLGSRVRTLVGRRAKRRTRGTRQERRVHAALARQEVARERGRAESRQF